MGRLGFTRKFKVEAVRLVRERGVSFCLAAPLPIISDNGIRLRPAPPT